MLKDVILGGKLRERRLERGWSKEDVATLYGQYIQPIKARTILAIEEGFVPKDPKRRLVLAGILGLAPAVLGISPGNEKVIPLPKAKHIDLQESKAVLLRYGKGGSLDDPQAAIKDLYTRAASIQSRVLYMSGPERGKTLELLCGLKIWLAITLREQGYKKNALNHFNDAVILSHEEDLPVFEGIALVRRGACFFDQGEFKRAEKDFDKALSIKLLPAQVEGVGKVLASLTKSHLARTEKEKTDAWSLLRGVDKLAGVTEGNPLYLINLPMAGFHRQSARIFMGPSVKKLRDTERADESLRETKKFWSTTHRGKSYGELESALVEAQIERDKGYYPLAVERAMTAIHLSTEMHSSIHIPLLKSIYEDICASSYGKDVSVAELGLQLLMLEYSHMFH